MGKEHESVAVVKCKSCGKATMLLKGLQIHVHWNGKEVEYYYCPDCNGKAYLEEGVIVDDGPIFS